MNTTSLAPNRNERDNLGGGSEVAAPAFIPIDGASSRASSDGGRVALGNPPSQPYLRQYLDGAIFLVPLQSIPIHLPTNTG